MNSITQDLSKLLASTTMLQLKTQNYHWNVRGMQFQPLHQVFEEQYDALAEATDELAERIRALGELAPGRFKDYLELSLLEEAKGQENAKQMLENLLKDHETLAKFCSGAIARAADAGDDGTADLITERIQEHQKTAWMLRSFLD